MAMFVNDLRPKTQARVLACEQADRMPHTSFYDTLSPLPPGAPGQLIRSQVVGGYVLPEGVRAVPISYQLHWIRERFDDRPASDNCAKWARH